MGLKTTKTTIEKLNTISLTHLGVGIGTVFAALINSIARNPSLGKQLFIYAILGFALAEAITLFGLMIAFLIFFSLFIFYFNIQMFQKDRKLNNSLIPTYKSALNKKNIMLIELDDKTKPNTIRQKRKMKFIKNNNFRLFSTSVSPNDNKLSSNDKVEYDSSNNKTVSSWKQLLILRLLVGFGLLIFLFFSYLLNESFDITKIYNQAFKFLSDENASNKIVINIKRCWHSYINIWDFNQWFFSVIAIIPAYWYLFDILFWIKLIDKKFTATQKIFFIGTDLLLNFVVGLVYMAHPNTVIGELMYQCPVALSPYFIIVELSVYILYRWWLKHRSHSNQIPHK